MTEKIHTIFPIKQDPSCLLKWGWSTIFFNSGTSASCHRTKKYSIDPNNFDQFHNLPDKLIARQHMLEGRWPGNGCEYCKNVEVHGGESDRIMHLKVMTDIGLSPPELLADATATSVTPTMLEVYFNNTCNMKCVYCGPHFSSLWEQENKKFQYSFGDEDANKFSVRKSQANPHYDRMVTDFWCYLHNDERYRVLRRFHILGGEPFLMAEMEQCINFWKDHHNPDLIVSMVTNLNIPHARFMGYMERFRELVETGCIMTVEIIASIDAWGPEQEYTRFGIDLDLWQKNFEAILTKPWVTVSINSALSALTIKQFHLLLERINHWNQLRESIAIDDHNRYIIHSFNLVVIQDNPNFFSGEVFGSDFEKILDLMPEKSQIQKNQKNAMKGIALAQSKCKNNLEKIQKLKDNLDILDMRRQTDWRRTFPWLDRDFSV